MRLIDADEMSKLYMHYGISHPYDAVDLDDMLAEMPTVDAIPVKWLIDRLEAILNSGALSGKPDDNLNIRSIIQVLRLWGIKMEVKA